VTFGGDLHKMFVSHNLHKDIKEISPVLSIFSVRRGGKIGIENAHKNFVRDCGFWGNRRSENWPLFMCVNNIILYFNLAFICRFDWNSVYNTCTIYGWSFASSVKKIFRESH